MFNQQWNIKWKFSYDYIELFHIDDDNLPIFNKKPHRLSPHTSHDI